MSFIVDYAANAASGLLATGITYAGTVAGNAVGGVGGMIEAGGRAAGDGEFCTFQSLCLVGSILRCSDERTTDELPLQASMAASDLSATTSMATAKA